MRKIKGLGPGDKDPEREWIREILRRPVTRLSSLSDKDFNALSMAQQRIILLLEQLAHMYSLDSMSAVASLISTNNREHGGRPITINTLSPYFSGGITAPEVMKQNLREALCRMFEMYGYQLFAFLADEPLPSHMAPVQTREKVRIIGAQEFIEACESLELEVCWQGLKVILARIEHESRHGRSGADAEAKEDFPLPVHPSNVKIRQLLSDRQEQLGLSEEQFLAYAQILSGDVNFSEVLEELNSSPVPCPNEWKLTFLPKVLATTSEWLINLSNGDGIDDQPPKPEGSSTSKSRQLALPQDVAVVEVIGTGQPSLVSKFFPKSPPTSATEENSSVGFGTP